MKKIIPIIFLTLACTCLQAQFGVKGGVNIANWGGEDADEEGKSALVGFYFGAFYNIEAGEHFSVQPEAVFSLQGVKYKESGIEVKIPTSHINITALLRYNAEGGFFVGVGPQIGFLMSAKIKAEGEEEDVKDSFKGTDIAAAIAIGYELESGLGFYARYNHGITQIPDEDDVKVFNRVFSIGLRYVFNKMGGEKK